jgi:hypothetical protein
LSRKNGKSSKITKFPENRPPAKIGTDYVQ